MQGISLASWIRTKPFLHKICRPIAQRYVDLAGYRKLGLK